MKKHSISILVFVVLMGLFLSSDNEDGGITTGIKKSGQQGVSVEEKTAQPGDIVKPDLSLRNFSLYFVTNKGQVNRKALFYAKAPEYTLWLTKEGLVFDSFKKNGNGNREIENWKTDQSTKSLICSERNISGLMFLKANKNPQVVALGESKFNVNYFIGNNKSKWHSDIPTSAAVLYKELYDNIDLKVFGVGKKIEYDWIINPGGNLADIKFTWMDVKGTHIDDQGNLVIETEFGKLSHKKPDSYQEKMLKGDQEMKTGDSSTEAAVEAKRLAVNVTFKKIAENTYGFSVDDYDKSLPLIIDPIVRIYSTYLGGGGEDRSMGIAIDGKGDIYITGYTYSTDFPIKNQYQPFQSSPDVFVTKINPFQIGSSSLVWSTYLGGQGNDKGYGIAVDSSCDVFVTGTTQSTNFPLKNEYDGNPASADAFVTRIDQSGNSLEYSTYLGSVAWDEGRGITCDNNGNAYVTGYTQGDGFPTNNPYQGDQAGDDAFVSKIDTTKNSVYSLIYSTYLGGNGEDCGLDITVDSTGCAYVTGYTYSTDFPTLNSYQTFLDIGPDVFVTKVDTMQTYANSFIYSTYLSGNAEDEGSGIAIDSSGYVYVTGKTNSTNFPAKNYFMLDPGDSSEDAFLTKIDTDQSGFTSLVYSTYFGGNGGDAGSDIAVGSSGNVFITGTTYSTDLRIFNEYQANQDMGDVFVSKLNYNDTTGIFRLIYSTYLGGDDDDFSQGIAVDNDCNVFITGHSYSTDFPTLNQYQGAQGGIDSFVTKLGSQDILILESPNSEEVWRQNTSKNITWFAECVEGPLKITLWRDIDGEGGNDPVSEGTIATDVPVNPPLFTWTAGKFKDGNSIEALGDGYMVKIKEVGSAVSDISDRAFYINGIAVFVPICGDAWAVGSQEEIKWDTDDVANTLKITLWQNGDPVGTIAKNVPYAQASYTWLVGECLKGVKALPGTNYQIKIKEQGTDINDISCPFEITGITVTVPDTLDVDWAYESDCDITWKDNRVTNNLIITLKENDNEIGTIADTVPPSSSPYTWNVGELMNGTAVPGNNYKVKIREKENAEYDPDESDAPFDIIGIALTHPIGDELWIPGDFENIEWTAYDITNNLTITLKKNDVPVGTIADDVPPYSSPYSWEVGKLTTGSAPPGYDYTIEIKENINGVLDESDSFDIKGLTVVAPNGGESWETGTSKVITWEAPGINTNLKIFLFKYGVNFAYVKGGIVPTSGSYQWLVGSNVENKVVTPSAFYKITITTVGSQDSSDAEFTIFD